MTKTQFIKHIKELVRIKKEISRVEDVIRKSPLNYNLSSITFGSFDYEDLSVNLLKEAMDDTFDYIGYFIYEMDMKFTDKKIIEEDGKNIPLRNFDDLYELVIKE